jgi:Cu2+-exporting ATPase
MNTGAAPEPLTAEVVEDGRIRVWGADLEDERTRRLLRWLSRRPDVEATEMRGGAHSVVIRYDEPVERRGGFARALRDELFVLALPRKTSPLTVRLEHQLPGRARLRVYHARDVELRRLAAWVGRLPGVTRVVPSEASGSILLLFDVDRTTAQEILEAARVSTASDWPPAPPIALARHEELRRTAFNSVVLGMVVAEVASPPIAALATCATALPPARRMLAALREKRLSVDVLDMAAIAISIGTGEPATAAFITWLLGIGDFVLERVSDSARNAMSKLAGIEVDDAWLVRGDRVERVRAKKLRRGDRIRVHTGDRVPADGVVVSGSASVDEKALTGESLPRTRRVGARVLAASVLYAGTIDVEVTRAGSDTAAANILRVLQGAGAKPMTLQRETERIADIVVLPTLGVAAAAGALSTTLTRTTSVLITDFGSGLRIAPPTAALATMTAAARRGVLVKGGQYLERLGKVDTIVFDKTGTLTAGSPQIVDVVATGSLGVHDALAVAAAAEAPQSHPNATAIRTLARAEGVPDLSRELRSSDYAIGAGVAAVVGDRRVLVGSRRLLASRGVDTARVAGIVERMRVKGASPVFTVVDGSIELVMAYTDVVRAEAITVLDELRADGRREIVLLSGDAAVSVDAIADALGIRRRKHRMLPEDKAREVRAMQRAGRVVAMVGDGINDAPALAVADVGISLYGSTEAALETADVLLVEGGLSNLPSAFALADIGMTNVKRSLALVIVPNAVAILLAATGAIGPGIATVINNGSTIAAALAAAAGPHLALRRARMRVAS